MADDDGNEIVCPMCRHWPCSCSSPHPQERDICEALRMEAFWHDAGEEGTETSALMREAADLIASLALKEKT